MNKKILLPALCLVALGITGCSKKVGQFKSDYFTVNPTPLEVQGTTIPATITGNIPAKFMVKNAKVQVTPVLVYSTGEKQATPYLIQGEDVRANGTVVSYINGGSVAIPFNMPYNNAMERSDLYLDFSVDQNGKVYALPRVKVGNGVISTVTLATAADVMPAIAKDSFQQVINEKYSADIHFLINQANIRESQLESEQYKDLNKRLQEAAAAPNQSIQGLTVSSFASPEGSLAFNTQLAEKREKATTTLVENQLKKDKITEFGELTSSFTPEDWEGFQKLVEASNIQDKGLILEVLRMYPDPEQREKELRNLASVFSELADQILPQLRYSRVMASISTIGKTNEQLVELFNTDPKALTPDEILYIATLTDDNNKKMEVYNTACTVFPKDYRTFNNLGVTQFIAGDYEGAQANFEHALRLNPQDKESELNLGLISMLNGKYNQAYEQFGMATDLPEINQAMGLYYLTQGNLPAAVSSFGDTKSNNAALAQLLSKDYTQARATLTSIPNPNATTYYLLAVVGARQGNENTVLNNLRQAIRLDPSMLQRAKNDLEFAKFNLSYL